LPSRTRITASRRIIRKWHLWAEGITFRPFNHDRRNCRLRAMPPPLRVLVVDDFEAWRRFVCSVLSKNPELQVIGEATDGLEAVQKAEELQPDLILLDVGLPSLNGIDAARRIRNIAPESKIIFLSQESSPEMVQEALSLGAWGYVVKGMAGADLLAAVETVLEGGQFVSGGPTSIDISTEASPD
jgi:DNA-binding NarL/FixJ family response regulator